MDKVEYRLERRKIMYKTRIYRGKLLLIEEGRVIGLREYNLLHNIKRMYIDFYKGLYYKYPVCCIIEFCTDNFKCVFSAANKKDKYGENVIYKMKTKHVPCNRCIQKYIRR